jgi:hypothetical protein
MIDGSVVLAKGGVSYSLGGDKLESIMGVDRFHGVKVTRAMAFIELTITDATDFDLRALKSKTDATVTAALENGKTVKFGHAAYVAEGKVSAEEGEIEARFECDPDDAEEIS